MKLLSILLQVAVEQETVAVEYVKQGGSWYLLLILLLGIFIYLIVRVIQLKNSNVDLCAKIYKLEFRIDDLETSFKDLSVKNPISIKDSFSIKEDGTIIRKE